MNAPLSPHCMLCLTALVITLGALSALAHDDRPKTPEQNRVYQELQAAAYHCAPAVAEYAAERKRVFAQKVLGGVPSGQMLTAGHLFGDNLDEPAEIKLLSCHAADDLKIRNNTCVLGAWPNSRTKPWQ
jgi:hypothetical protein